MAQWAKYPSAMQEMQETWVQFLIQENPLEDAMATHSTILAWRQRSLDRGYGPRSLTGYGSWGFKEPDMTEATEHACQTTVFFFFMLIWSRYFYYLWHEGRLPTCYLTGCAILETFNHGIYHSRLILTNFYICF